MKPTNLAIEALLTNDEGYTWGNLLQPIEELEDELAKAWSPVSHLNGVCNSDELREAYNVCLPLLSEYSTWMGQHSQLCAAYQQIADGKAFTTLDTAQQKSIDQALRDFRLAGVALPSEKKTQYGELRQRLSKLGSAFGENVLDATNAWSKQVTAEQLRGLPETAMASAKAGGGCRGTPGLPDQPRVPVVVTRTDLLRRPAAAGSRLHRALHKGVRARARRWPVGQYGSHHATRSQLRSELAQLLGISKLCRTVARDKNGRNSG